MIAQSNGDSYRESNQEEANNYIKAIRGELFVCVPSTLTLFWEKVAMFPAYRKPGNKG